MWKSLIFVGIVSKDISRKFKYQSESKEKMPINTNNDVF